MKYKFLSKRTPYFSSSKEVYRFLQKMLDGGKGSGFWGHKGRPGKVGGSSSTGGAEISLDNLTDTQIKEVLDSKELKDKWGGAGKRLAELALTNKSVIKRIQSALSGGKTIFKNREERDAADALLETLPQGSDEYLKLNKKLRQDDFFADLIDIAEQKFGTGLDTNTNEEPIENKEELTTETEPTEKIEKSANPKEWNKTEDSKKISSVELDIKDNSLSDYINEETKKALYKIKGIAHKKYLGDLNSASYYTIDMNDREKDNYLTDIKENIDSIIGNFISFDSKYDKYKIKGILQEKYLGINSSNKFMAIKLLNDMNNFYNKSRYLIETIADRLHGKNWKSQMPERDTLNRAAFDMALLCNFNRICSGNFTIRELLFRLDLPDNFIGQEEFDKIYNKLYGEKVSSSSNNNNFTTEYYEDSNNDYLNNRIEELYTAKLNSNGDYIAQYYTEGSYVSDMENSLNNIVANSNIEEMRKILKNNWGLISDLDFNDITDKDIKETFSKNPFTEYYPIDFENITKENIDETVKEVLDNTDMLYPRIGILLLKGMVEKLDNGMSVEDLIDNANYKINNNKEIKDFNDIYNKDYAKQNGIDNSANRQKRQEAIDSYIRENRIKGINNFIQTLGKKELTDFVEEQRDFIEKNGFSFETLFGDNDYLDSNSILTNTIFDLKDLQDLDLSDTKEAIKYLKDTYAHRKEEDEREKFVVGASLINILDSAAKKNGVTVDKVIEDNVFKKSLNSDEKENLYYKLKDNAKSNPAFSDIISRLVEKLDRSSWYVEPEFMANSYLELENNLKKINLNKEELDNKETKDIEKTINEAIESNFNKLGNSASEDREILGNMGAAFNYLQWRKELDKILYAKVNPKVEKLKMRGNYSVRAIPQWTDTYKISSPYNEEVLKNSYKELQNLPSIKNNYVNTTGINSIDFKQNGWMEKVKKILPNIDSLPDVEIDNHNKDYLGNYRSKLNNRYRSEANDIWDNYFKAHAYANNQKRDNRGRKIDYDRGKESMTQPKIDKPIIKNDILNFLSDMTSGGGLYFPALDGNFGGIGGAIRTIVACADTSEKTQWRAEDMGANYRNYANLKVGDSITFNAQHFTDNEDFFNNSAFHWFGEKDPIVFELRGKKPLLNLSPFASSLKVNEYESLVAGFCKVKAIENYANGNKTCKKVVLEYDWDRINEYVKLQAKSYANELGFYKNYKKKENK